jgi:hypothetical protein
VESSCKHGNEPSGSITCWETTEWLHNLWPLERYSAPQSWAVLVILIKNKNVLLTETCERSLLASELSPFGQPENGCGHMSNDAQHRKLTL